MTKIGMKLCILCGRASRETIFYAPSLTTSFTVAKDLHSRYCLLPKSTGREVSSVHLREKPTLDPDSGEITKITGTISFKGSSQRHAFTLRTENRICPHCLQENKITQLPPYAGMANAFLLGIAGLPGTGKSVLLNAAFTGQSISSIRSALHGCRLETGLSAEDTTIDATQLAENNPLRLLKTVRVVTPQGKLAALLYLKDSPGELFDPKNFGSDAWERHFAPFAQCDAMLYAMDHRLIQAQGMVPDSKLGDPEPFLQKLPRHIPTAVVLTKADKLSDSLPLRTRDGRQILLNRASPIFQATPPRGEAIAQRMALDQQLILELVPSLTVSPLPHNDLVGYFTLSSGLDRSDGSFDYEPGYNQHLPLLFLLNALGLGSLIGKE